MDDRLLALMLVALMSASVWGAVQWYRAWTMRRNHQTVMQSPRELTAIGLPADGQPVIIGFTGEYCAPCRTYQHPALEKLRQQFRETLHIQEVDALAYADLAQRYGVLTVPTTVVLDGSRKVVAINYGVASAEKLRQQVAPYVRG
jgi:thioredoxin 1